MNRHALRRTLRGASRCCGRSPVVPARGLASPPANFRCPSGTISLHLVCTTFNHTRAHAAPCTRLVISRAGRISCSRLSPPKEYLCPHCQVAKKLRSAHAFANVRCTACGGEWRPRREVGGYRLLEPLARSGLGMIFRAAGPESDVPLAVKVLRPPFGFTQDDLERFSQDIQILAAHEHPHWLRVHAGGIEEDLAWLAMEWLPEGSLADLLAARGRLDEKAALEFAAQAASALAAAHDAGLSHHNLQLINCLLADAQTLKVAGFAEANFYERAGEEVGALWGRLCCAPPERVFGDAEDARSEIYALGAILFQALAGTLPYDGETMPELFYARIGGSSLRLENFVSPIRKTTAQAVDRMLALGPSRRFQSWEEAIEGLAGALESLSQGGSPAAARPRAVAVRAAAKPPVHSAKAGAWFSILMLAAIVGIAGWFGWRHWHKTEPPAATVAMVSEEPAAPPAPVVSEAPDVVTSVPATPVAAKPPRKRKPPAVAVIATPAPAATPEPAATPMPAAADIAKLVAPQPARPKKDWSGWTTSLIESPTKPKGAVQGEAHPVPGTDELRVSGNNTGVEGTHDECVFHARELLGDWTLSARIVVPQSAAAALCARAWAGSDQPCLAVIVAANGKVTSAVRKTPGAKADIKPLLTPIRPAWLKLTRRGTKLTAFYGLTKGVWTPAESLDLPALPASIPAGLMVWSGTKEKAAVTFDEITVSFEK